MVFAGGKKSKPVVCGDLLLLSSVLFWHSFSVGMYADAALFRGALT